MSDQFNYIKVDERNSYTTQLRNNRLNQAMQPLKGTIEKMDSPTRVFSAKSLSELDAIRVDYEMYLAPGDLSVLFDANNFPSKIYAWSGAVNGWQEMPSVSVTGPVLVEATSADKGIAQFATHNEKAGLKAVQADDPRLNQEWVASSTAPLNTGALWIDTSLTEPAIKWHNGTEWTNVSNSKLINDAVDNIKTTLSSTKIKELLTGKAAASHSHKNADDHIGNISNPHGVKASQLSDFHVEVAKNSTVKANAASKHDHSNKTVLDGLTEAGNELLYKTKPIGKGDMLKSVYDTGNKGYVDKAEALTNGTKVFTILDLESLTAKTHEHSNANVLSQITAPFTTELADKLSNISAGANSYSHPINHPASIITQDTNNRFVTDLEKLQWSDKYTKAEVDQKLVSKVDRTMLGLAGGIATLNPDGTIPMEQIPMKFKETKVVETIAERDLLVKYSGLRVFVADAADDVTVGAGSAEYVWNGTKWILLSGFGLNNGSMQFMVDETNNKLVVKVRYANGVLKTGLVSLT